MIRATIAAAIAAIAIAGPAAAGTPHVTLARAIERSGVDLQINPSDCAARTALGWYNSLERRMVVCLEGGPGAKWTAEDLDTLRHEAQHLIQDCVAGDHHDGALAPMFDDVAGMGRQYIGQDAIDRIVEQYASQGAPLPVLILEVEAFTAAAMDVPVAQAEAIGQFCF